MFGCVSAYFCGGHKITYGCNFLATLPLIWVGFSGTCFVVVVGGGGLPPYPQLLRIMLET